jgi:hypothetical protein
LRLGVLLGVGLAGGNAARDRVGRRSRTLGVAALGITRVGSALIRIRPFGRIRVAHRVIQHMVRFGIAGSVSGIAARRLGKAGGGFLVFHARMLPRPGRAKLWPS